MCFGRQDGAVVLRYAIWYLVHLPFGGLPIDMIPSSKFYNMATNIDIELILTQT